MPYKDAEKQKKFQREYRRKLNQERRLKVLDLLGNKCVKCSIEDFRVLEIDHIEPLLRGENGIISGTNICDQVITNKVKLDDLQLLCANCHRIKTFEDRFKFRNYIQ